MEQNPESRNIRFEFPNIIIEATPSNAVVYLHEGEDSKYDHVYIENQPDPDEDAEFYYIFRRNLSDFEKTLEVMRSKGYTFVELAECSEFDKKQYYKLFPPESNLKTYELTPRQERFVDYFSYILEKEELAPDDFAVPGDLYL